MSRAGHIHLARHLPLTTVAENLRAHLAILARGAVTNMDQWIEEHDYLIEGHGTRGHYVGRRCRKPLCREAENRYGKRARVIAASRRSSTIPPTIKEPL